MVICLERDADLHVAQLMPLPLTGSCFSKIQISFWYRLTRVIPEKGPLNGCVCVRKSYPRSGFLARQIFCVLVAWRPLCRQVGCRSLSTRLWPVTHMHLSAVTFTAILLTAIATITWHGHRRHQSFACTLPLSQRLLGTNIIIIINNNNKQICIAP